MSIFGIGGTKGGDANDYIYKSGKLSIPLDRFNGTLAQLKELISRETEQCAQYVKDGGTFRNKNAARDVCSDAIDSYYAPAMARLQEESYFEETTVKNEFLKGNSNMYIIAAVALILILLVMYL